VRRVAGLSWTSTLMPGGAIGVRLKLNAPCSCAHAERLGLMCDPYNMLRDNSAWGSKWSQRWMGKSLSVLQSPAMKCSSMCGWLAQWHCGSEDSVGPVGNQCLQRSCDLVMPRMLHCPGVAVGGVILWCRVRHGQSYRR